MTMRQSQFSSLLIPMISHFFDLGKTRVPSMRQRLFSVMNSTLASEKGTGMGGMSPDAWDQYNQSGTKGQMSMDQLYTQTYTHREYPVKIEIEKRLLLNDQYGIIRDYLTRVGISAEQKMEIDAANALNNAFSSSYTWSDGVALCSASHPKSPNVASGTFSNRGTTALSKAEVSAARILMQRFKDDKGNEIGLMPNELWVPPELEDTALEITKSLQDPSTANNAINPQAGRWTVIPWQRLTDTNNWFMMDSVWRQQVAKWYVREASVPMLVEESTTHEVYEVKLHYSYGFDDWRFIYGEEVA